MFHYPWQVQTQDIKVELSAIDNATESFNQVATELEKLTAVIQPQAGLSEALASKLPHPSKALLSMPKPHRGKRSRSQQCRGSRARNYVRAYDRASRSRRWTSAAVINDAEYSGALAALRHAQDKQWARDQKNMARGSR